MTITLTVRQSCPVPQGANQHGQLSVVYHQGSQLLSDRIGTSIGVNQELSSPGAVGHRCCDAARFIHYLSA